MVVPIAAGDRVIGIVTLGTSHSARRLGEAELALADELGRRAGIAVENARLHDTRSQIATTLQRSLLPPRLPVVPGVTIAARFRAAGETSDVGGDFYDVFGVGDAWMVIVGDVTGKGPGAATDHLAGPLHDAHRGDVRALPRRRARAAELGARRRPRAPPICTAVCARIEPAADGTLLVTLACGGHPPPFLITAAGGAETVGTPGPLLGAFDGGVWEERHVRAGRRRGAGLLHRRRHRHPRRGRRAVRPGPAERPAGRHGGARRRRGLLAHRRGAAGLRARPAARRRGPARAALRG